MKTYKATTINGEPKLEPVNPHQRTLYESDGAVNHVDSMYASIAFDDFKKANPPIPYIGPAIPDGTIMDESEVEIKWQGKAVKGGKWNDYDQEPSPALFRRRVAALKAKEPERGYTITSVSNSEEGEQPMKEAEKIIRAIQVSVCIGDDYHYKPIQYLELIQDNLRKQGYTLTKK